MFKCWPSRLRRHCRQSSLPWNFPPNSSIFFARKEFRRKPKGSPQGVWIWQSPVLPTPGLVFWHEVTSWHTFSPRARWLSHILMWVSRVISGSTWCSRASSFGWWSARNRNRWGQVPQGLGPCALRIQFAQTLLYLPLKKLHLSN